jgi:hypothetical protein
MADNLADQCNVSVRRGWLIDHGVELQSPNFGVIRVFRVVDQDNRWTVLAALQIDERLYDSMIQQAFPENQEVETLKGAVGASPQYSAKFHFGRARIYGVRGTL